MPDELPPLSLGLGDNNENLVVLETTDEHAPNTAADMAELLRILPALATEAHAVDLARAVNHFKRGTDYRVIENPAEFAADYRARIEREDPAAPWQENVVRLRDYGVPDFSQIQPPKFAGGKLTFHAVDTFLGVPYQVEAANLEAAPEYHAMPLTPLPRPPAPASASAAEEPHTTTGPQEDRVVAKNSLAAWRAANTTPSPVATPAADNESDEELPPDE